MKAPLKLACILLLGSAAFLLTFAQNAPPNATNSPPPDAAATNSAAAQVSDPASTNQDNQAKKTAPDEIQLSFQGANVDMIAQWLAQTTGKSVIKHPQVQCQLTIMSSKKLPPREAISLVYRALAMEGFSAVESADSIFLVPQDKEPKFNPEILDGSSKNIPEGRQRLVKIFPLAHLQAADLREKLRGL